MKYKNIVPRAILKKFQEDMVKLTGTHEGRLYILEMLEEIPFELRPAVIEGFSSFHEPAMIEFFHLVKREYGQEYDRCCKRALEKYKLMGMCVDDPIDFQGSFYTAYASCSRQTGRIALDIAWDTGGNGLHVECFYLTYHTEGIHSFFVSENMSLVQYLRDRKSAIDMIELSYEEACFLVNRAYQMNLRSLSRPALGKYLYEKYLQDVAPLSTQAERKLLRSVSSRLSPRQVVNSLFHCLKYQDYAYMISLLSPRFFGQNGDFKSDELLPAENILLEGGVREVQGHLNSTLARAYAVSARDREFYCREYSFNLSRDKNGLWYISRFETIDEYKLDCSAQANPFCSPIFCRVYEIVDIECLFQKLDDIDRIREIKELPYGMHMRITCQEDDMNHGISFLSGVVADLVINGEEFVIISSDKRKLLELHHYIYRDSHGAVALLGEYEVQTATAYRYLSGHYISFEDILWQEDAETTFEDGMRMVCARYLVRNWQKVSSILRGHARDHFALDQEYQVYYQIDDHSDEAGFFAEYILGPTWITLSTFGDRDMKRARQRFETELFDCLEFEGMEIREDTIFDVLTSDIKKERPDLLGFLKDSYLNKWYYSRLVNLKGMSPSEACQTVEGSRMLWAMFKKIKSRENMRHACGRPNSIFLKEYIQKVEQKREKNI